MKIRVKEILKKAEIRDEIYNDFCSFIKSKLETSDEDDSELEVESNLLKGYLLEFFVDNEKSKDKKVLGANFSIPMLYQIIDKLEFKHNNNELLLSLIDPYIRSAIKSHINKEILHYIFTDKLEFRIARAIMSSLNMWTEDSLKLAIVNFDESDVLDTEDIDYMSQIVNNMFSLDINDTSREFYLDQFEKYIKKYWMSDTTIKYNNTDNKLSGVKNLLENLKAKTEFTLLSGVEKEDNLLDPLDSQSVGNLVTQVASNGILKSSMDIFNISSAAGGYMRGDLAAVSAPPKCLLGDTKIHILSENKVETIENLYKNQNSIELSAFSYIDEGVTVNKYSKVNITDYTDEYLDLEIDNKYHVKCTKDHLWLMRDGSYKKAIELEKFDSLMPFSREVSHEYYEGISGGYEVVKSIGKKYYTHRLVKSKLKELNPELTGTVAHRKDHNKLNNQFNNLQIMTNEEHREYHNNKMKGKHFSPDTKFKKGQHASRATEFTSETNPERMRLLWSNPEYKEKMRVILSEAAKNSENNNIREYNKSKENQKYNKKQQVLKYLNTLITKFGIDNLTVDNYYDLSYELEGYKHRATLSGIAKAYNVYDENKEVYLNNLKKIWDSILEDAKNYNHQITNITLVKLDEKVPVYDLIDCGEEHNFAVALDENTGIFSHNCGKSTFLIQETIAFLKQGFKVLHVCLGDMSNFDLLSKLIARLNYNDRAEKQNPYYQINNLMQGTRIYEELIKKDDESVSKYTRLQNLRISSLPAGSYDIFQLLNYCDTCYKQVLEFDALIVDYDSNIKGSSDNMYESSGIIYEQLKAYAKKMNIVVIVASQPKIYSWEEEILGMEVLSESSRKQHTIDSLVTINKNKDANIIGTFNIACLRRGQKPDTVTRIKMDYAYSAIHSISNSQYELYRKNAMMRKKNDEAMEDATDAFLAEHSM